MGEVCRRVSICIKHFPLYKYSKMSTLAKAGWRLQAFLILVSALFCTLEFFIKKHKLKRQDQNITLNLIYIHAQ